MWGTTHVFRCRVCGEWFTADELGRCAYHPHEPVFGASATERHEPYFEHMRCLHPSLQRVLPGVSGVAHHMVFERSLLRRLFVMVEAHHRTSLWRAFLGCVG